MLGWRRRIATGTATTNPAATTTTATAAGPTTTPAPAPATRLILRDAGISRFAILNGSEHLNGIDESLIGLRAGRHR